MSKMQCNVTVYYESPFWVAVYERRESGQVEACRIVFGAEPREAEVYALLLEQWAALRFSPPVRDDGAPRACCNPKRLQRQIAKSLAGSGIGTKAQQALSLQRAEGLLARRQRTRAEREADNALRFQLRREKKKRKHRGH